MLRGPGGARGFKIYAEEAARTASETRMTRVSPALAVSVILILQLSSGVDGG